MIAISSASGFFGCKVSLDAAKREVQSTLNPGKMRPPASPHHKDPEFSVLAKKLFEAAQVVSTKLNRYTVVPNDYCQGLSGSPYISLLKY